MSKVRRWWVSSFPTSTPSLPISPTALASLACVSREIWWRQLFLKIFSQRMPKGVFYPQPSQPAGALIWSTDAVNAKWTWPNCIRHEMHWNTITGIDMIHTVHEPNCNDLSSSCQVRQEDSVFLRWENSSTLMHQHAPTMFQDCRFNSRGVGRGKTFRKRILVTRKLGSFPWPRLKDSP